MVIKRPKLTAAKSPIQQAAKYPEPHLLLAQKWMDTQNVEGYWISEKLDGVRAYYDHKHRVFLSRMGNVYHAPPWFSEGYPEDMALDGEFYMGRQTFQQTQQVIKDPNSLKWKQLKFYVFDSPNLTSAFEERHEALVNYFKDRKSTATVMTHQLCKGRDHVYELLKHYESLGGEGVMLRKPKSHYVGKRSASLLKVKSFYDAEARVEEVIPGKGKYTGMMGALQCSMANGLSFKIGTGYSDKDRVTPPRLGSIITYRFQELSSEGIPKFPAFVAVRIDASEPRDADIPAHKRGRGGDDEE
jgi:DNA ligase-1